MEWRLDFQRFRDRGDTPRSAAKETMLAAMERGDLEAAQRLAAVVLALTLTDHIISVVQEGA